MKITGTLIFKVTIVILILILGYFLIAHRKQKFTNPGSGDPGAQIKRDVQVVSTSAVHSECEAKSAPSEQFECYQLAFQAFMNDNGAKKTLSFLDDLEKLGGYVQMNCHPLAHKIGNIAYHFYGTVAKAAPEYLPVCASGYYHGVLEEYLATAPSYAIGIEQACGKADGQIYFNWFQCTHGLGHGIMQARTDEVPQSLKDCDLLGSDHSADQICYGGVFMENITTEEKTGHKSKYVKPSNPIYPCDIVEERYKGACYFLSSSMILKLNGWNFEEAFKVCDTAEQKYRWLCYQSMGRDVSGSTLRNKERVKDLCLLGKLQTAREECYFGAVRDFINDKGEFDSAIDLCAFLDEQYQGRCFSGVFLDLSLYHTGQSFLAICAKMPEPYLAECKVKAPR